MPLSVVAVTNWVWWRSQKGGFWGRRSQFAADPFEPNPTASSSGTADAAGSDHPAVTLVVLTLITSSTW